MILFLFTLRAQAIDIVFDIDWTLVYTVGKEQAGKRNVFFVEGKYYYLTDGATEIIELLLVDGVDVSFFSGGKRSRNFELLKKIKLSDGRSLYEISKKILSYEELHHVADASPKARFAERLKKDLRLISNDLDNIILVDDIPNFTPTGQEKNIFHLTAYEHFSKFSEVQKNSHLTHKPVDSIDWMLERNKLVWFYSQYSEVKELVRSKNINLVTAFEKIKLNPKDINYKSIKIQKVLYQGLALKAQFPNMSINIDPMSCRYLFK